MDRGKKLRSRPATNGGPGEAAGEQKSSIFGERNYSRLFCSLFLNDELALDFVIRQLGKWAELTMMTPPYLLNRESNDGSDRIG